MDADVYRSLVLEHKDRVHSYAAWMLKDLEEARDVTQEALIRLWKNRSKVIPETSRAWLLRTTYRLCIDRMRRKKVRREVAGENILDPVPDLAAGPERLTDSSMLGRAISEALGRLGEADRTIVLLREVQGMAYDEIARTMNMPMGTIKAKLHRARERLRRDLAASGVTP